MRICIFDDAIGGHHLGYLEGVVRAAALQGVYPLVASPKRPAVLNEATGRWLSVPSVKLRQVRAGRRSLRSVIKTCTTEGIGLFLNLFLDKTVWTVPREISRIPRRVHVLHHTPQYTYEARGNAGKLRTIEARRRLTAWARRGDVVAVHTERGHEVLSQVLPLESLVLLGYPVDLPSATGSPQVAIPTHDAVELLFVGQARRQKGLSHLLGALRWLPNEVRVKVVGPQNPKIRAQLETSRSGSRVTWVDEYVSDSQLSEHFEQASLVVLPYEASFGRDGGASGVLLESLAHGVPFVTTRTLEPQLPPVFDGAIVVEPENPEALAAGITQALENLPAMEAAARNAGPAFILENHSFEKYLHGLLVER